MANVTPKVITNTKPRDLKILLFERLKPDSGNSDWAVLNSLNIAYQAIRMLVRITYLFEGMRKH